mmetsp:Transcript_72604/g.193652  ORF Transcript_72604/g.193652 Transcript_72604/m.193652 type:complete len:214 (+) Transcript_72604:1101-1742(+)
MLRRVDQSHAAFVKGRERAVAGAARHQRSSLRVKQMDRGHLQATSVPPAAGEHLLLQIPQQNHRVVASCCELAGLLPPTEAQATVTPYGFARKGLERSGERGSHTVAVSPILHDTNRSIWCATAQQLPLRVARVQHEQLRDWRMWLQAHSARCLLTHGQRRSNVRAAPAVDTGRFFAAVSRMVRDALAVAREVNHGQQPTSSTHHQRLRPLPK